MATQYMPDPTPTTVAGWKVEIGDITLTATSEGLRVRKPAGGKGGYISSAQWSFSKGRQTMGFGGIKLRRNTAASVGGFSWAIQHAGTDNTFVSWRGTAYSQAKVGSWIRTVRLADGNGVAASTADMPAGGFGHAELYFTGDDVAYDVTITDLQVYNLLASDMPGSATPDANDLGFTISVPVGALGPVTFTHDGLNNEQIDWVDIDWGADTGSTSEQTISSFGDVQFKPFTKTYAKPGVYDVVVTGYSQGFAQPPTYKTARTYQIKVPSGNLDAKFTTTVDYPTVIADGSTSVAPVEAPITRYTWNWGDGSSTTGIKSSHGYASPGTYNITLTVVNGTTGWQDVATHVVVVSPAEAPTTSPTTFGLQVAFDDPKFTINPDNPGGQADCIPIIGADAIQYNWTRNEASRLTFQVPSTWISDALGVGATLASLKSDVILRVNYGAGWVEAPNGRFVVDSVDTDPLNPQSPVKVGCVLAIPNDLDGTLLVPSLNGVPYTRAEAAANYARIADAVTPGRAFGLWVSSFLTTYLPYVSFDFTDALDSKGTAWTTLLSNVQVPPTATGLDMLDSFVDNGACDWFCYRNVLKMFNPGLSGQRASGDAVPELVAGRDVGAAPQTRSLNAQTYGAVVVSQDSLPFTVSDTDASSPSHQASHYRGNRYVAIQADNVNTSNTALVAAKPTLAALNAARDGEMTREIKFYPDMPWMVFRDYRVGDYVYAPGPDGTIALMPVEGITLGLDAGKGLTGSLTLGSAFSVNALVKKVNNLSGGGGVRVGAAGTKPPSSLTGFIKQLVASEVTCDNGSYDAGNQLTLSGVGATGRAAIGLGSDATGARMWCLAAYSRSYSNAANMYITSAGTFGRSTSATKYKVNIQPKDFGEAVLDLQPKVWYDRTASETWAALLDETHGDVAQAAARAAEGDLPPLVPTPGLIAEDVDAVGLGEFVQRHDETGEIEGLSYDRLWVPLIPIIRNQREQLQAQAGRIEARDRVIEELLQRVESLENAMTPSTT